MCLNHFKKSVYNAPNRKNGSTILRYSDQKISPWDALYLFVIFIVVQICVYFWLISKCLANGFYKYSPSFIFQYGIFSSKYSK